MQIVRIGRLTTGEDDFDTDIRDMTVMRYDDHVTLLAATGPLGGVAAYDLTARRGPTLIDTQGYQFPDQANFAAGVGALARLDVGGGLAFAIGGAPNIGLRGFRMAGDGTVGRGTEFATGDGLRAGDVVDLVQTAPDRLHVVEGDGTGLVAYDADARGNLTRGWSDAGEGVGRIVALSSAGMDGTDYVLAACAATDAVVAYRVDQADGALVETGRMGAERGFGMMTPTDMSVATTGGRTYVLTTSAADGGQGGAIAVMELTSQGALVPMDHLLDGRDTRFGRAQAIAVVEVGDRVLVLAAGGDDGLALLTLLPDGRLLHLHSLAEAGDGALRGLSGIEVVRDGARLDVFTASQGGTGLGRFAVDLGDLGRTTIAGGGRADGTSRDDLLSGKGGSDRLSGRGGDDILVDGAGRDSLTGGPGADTFVLQADGARDRIEDFEVGIDRIDITGWGRIHALDAVDFRRTGHGAEIAWGDEVLEIRGAGGRSLSREEVDAALRLGATHLPLGVGLTLSGSSGPERLEGGANADLLDGDAGDDTLLGGDGGDTLLGGAGADRLSGEAGDDVLDGGGWTDVLSGGAGADTVRGGLGRDTAYLGDGADLWIDEGQDGSRGADLVYGDAGADTLQGLGGDDTLFGGTGADVVSGGAGRDRLLGQDGADHLAGGAGGDRLDGGRGDDTILGGWGADTIVGGPGGDRVLGGLGSDRVDLGPGADLFQDVEAGWDRVAGGDGRDTIEGGDGNDRLDGNRDADVLRGGSGDDTILGGQGGDRIEAGAGDDVVNGGFGPDEARLGDGDDRYVDTDQADIWGRDTVYGWNGVDIIDAGGGDDLIHGGEGGDALSGAGGHDAVFGDAGADTLRGGTGNDRLEGGAGQDTFVFEAMAGFDRVVDFDIGSDRLRFTAPGTTRDDLDLTQQGTATVLRHPDGTILLEDVTAGALGHDDFLFG